MAWNQKLGTTTILLAFLLVSLRLAATSSASAQDRPAPPEMRRLATNDLNSEADPVWGATDEKAVADSPAQTTGANTSKASSEDDQWHINVSPYLWFPAMYGTVGFPNRNLHVHASAGDLLSHFRFGLMGTVEFRRKWLVLPVDMIWVRLGDDHPVPLEAGVTTANIKVQEFILTPEVGIRFLNQERFKIDFVTGFRYWHLGNSLGFNPSALGLSFSNSLNWVDPLIGGRIQAALSPKLVTNIIGDVGGWGTGSLIEYEVGGVLGYKIKPKWTLQAGYRYMRVDYRSGLFLYNVHNPGAVLGVTWNAR